MASSPATMTTAAALRCNRRSSVSDVVVGSISFFGGGDCVVWCVCVVVLPGTILRDAGREDISDAAGVTYVDRQVQAPPCVSPEETNFSSNLSGGGRWIKKGGAGTGLNYNPSIFFYLTPYEIECLLCLEHDPEDFTCPCWTIDAGLCELAKVSELLFSPFPKPFPTIHSFSNILLERDGSSWGSDPLLFPPLFACFPFSTNCSSSFIFISSNCILSDLRISVGPVLAQFSRLCLGELVLLAEAFACSKNSTWTTTRSGNCSF
ncbi:plant invertase/pectin methylesterase inhibitor [Striga asiatica]|uniref:Plant invertase/pectin methylesterase inhibitor n=1 Tax=Striga asiatica TaxID=4170 RepID=A0A5A7PCY3_STRAF|nr:plant invertase/pectin methylesterase inhibitor [Striga asiatica]